MKASTIYLYSDDRIEVIVHYGLEAIIINKVYQIKGGSIEKQFIREFYKAIDDEKAANYFTS